MRGLSVGVCRRGDETTTGAFTAAYYHCRHLTPLCTWVQKGGVEERKKNPSIPSFEGVDVHVAERVLLNVKNVWDITRAQSPDADDSEASATMWQLSHDLRTDRKKINCSNNVAELLLREINVFINYFIILYYVAIQN